jgi:hypothetical protein
MMRKTFPVLLLLALFADPARALEFSVDVMSVLSKAGCNAGTCHGNLNGKGGFKLSLRGQDPAFDYHSLVLSSRGRKVNLTLPEQSLILQKATGEVAHRGGKRFDATSVEYQVLLNWLREGANSPSPKTPTLVNLEVQPLETVIRAPADHVQVHVQANFSDGSSRDVTDRACYELSNLIANVEPSGRVVRNQFGETTLIARYLQKQVPVSIAFTQARPDFQWDHPPAVNELDEFVFAKLKRLRINPSPLSDDTTFVRRAYLDAIGRAPSVSEARGFIQNGDPRKRTKLIDQLLSRAEFADFWALKWADVLRTEEKVLDTKGVQVFHGWIRENIAAARPWDQFVRELVTGTGKTFEQPAANYYRANRDATTRGETTARLFLGTRLQCAKCHNHPFDQWTQEDYYQWSSIFSQLDYELGENKRSDKLDQNEFAGDQVVLVAKQDEVRNPTTGKVSQPKFLGGRELQGDDTKDRLAAVANWLTSRDNPLFARSQANFIWSHLMGQGLVDPIDDFRLTNPASNSSLLDMLAEDFISSGFDLRFVVRKIMNSRTYQLASEPNDSNLHDQTSYSRSYVRRLSAEVILDMQSDLLEAPAGFAGYPAGIRAVQIPGVKSKQSRGTASQPGDRFLKTFGKPERILACECERSNETTLKQALVLLGDGLSERLAASGNKIQRLAASTKSDAEVIAELYWSALSRPPSNVEESAALQAIQSSTTGRAAALEDLVWALLNAKEFLFRK